MDRIKKLIILCFCALIIGAQSFIVLVPYSIIWGDNWKMGDKPFWPFMRYPMYANGKKPGDRFIIFELRAGLPGKEQIKIVSNSLHIKGYRFEELLWKVFMMSDKSFRIDRSFYKDFIYLNNLIKKNITNRGTVALWGKTYTISEAGIIEESWKEFYSWIIGEEKAFIQALRRFE